jgi:hypothetical protein
VRGIALLLVSPFLSWVWWVADEDCEGRRESTDRLCRGCDQPGIPNDPDAGKVRRAKRLSTQHRTSLLSLLCSSLTAPQNEALVGLRNSAILHYDFRIPDKSSVVSRLELGKSVCGIKALDEGRGGGRSFIASGYTHQVSESVGDMEMVLTCHQLALFDLRFPKTGPVRRYQDHVNDYRSGLVSAISASRNFADVSTGSDGRSIGNTRLCSRIRSENPSVVHLGRTASTGIRETWSATATRATAPRANQWDRDAGRGQGTRVE